MYCSACATPLAPGLSYCNRCGMSLKERTDNKSTIVASYLSAITIVGLGGLGLMLGGAVALRNGAMLGEEVVGIFMLMTFAIVAIVELSLCRQLSRVNRAAEKKEFVPAPMIPPTEIRGSQPRSLAEPLPSVTENTTRTLEYAHHDPPKFER